MTMDVLNSRSSYLNNVETLMTRCSSKLESLVTSIGWTMDSLTKHVKDDDLDEDPLLPNSSEDVKVEAPVSENKDFEKLYNDLLTNLPNQPKKEKSEAELLVHLLELERNMKRRRISYKNKVHTKNKSHTEVLRALVGEQMNVLKEIAGPEVTEGTGKRAEIKESDDAGLIQLGYPRGNPYATWQKIGQVVEFRSLSDSGERIYPGRDDSSRWKTETKSRDCLQHQSNKWRHSKESPRPSGKFQSEHDDRYRRERQRSELDSDRPKYDKRRKTPDRFYKHKHRSHRSKSPSRS